MRESKYITKHAFTSPCLLLTRWCEKDSDMNNMFDLGLRKCLQGYPDHCKGSGPGLQGCADPCRGTSVHNNAT